MRGRLRFLQLAPICTLSLLYVFVLLLLITDNELYSMVVDKLKQWAPRLFLGNNIHEHNSSLNIVLSAVLHSFLGFAYFASAWFFSSRCKFNTAVPEQSSSEIRLTSEVLFKLCLLSFPSVIIYILTSILESRYGEGPLVQLFGFPLMIAFVSMVIRIEALGHFRGPRIEAAMILIAFPAAILVWPHWSVLIMQVLVGLVVAAHTVKLCAAYPLIWAARLRRD